MDNTEKDFYYGEHPNYNEIVKELASSLRYEIDNEIIASILYGDLLLEDDNITIRQQTGF